MTSLERRDCGMMVSVRSKYLAGTSAGIALAAAAVTWVVALGGGGEEGGDGSQSGEPAAAETRVAETTPPDPALRSGTAPPPPVTATTTTTLASSTTTTAPPETMTTSRPPVSTSNGYTPVPKPAAEPNTVPPGGALTKHQAEYIATAFGLDVADVEAAIAELELPPEAAGNAEGWLAPGTYRPADGTSAGEMVQAMVDRRVAQLEERNVPREQWHRVVTAASVIEKETYNQNEKPRVAQVLANRLAGGGPLQMDSIILYPVPEDRIFTTSEERASDQPYNSYKHNGLPPTPICSPDEASLDAFLAPPPGDWWFYVTIDLNSGETRYAVTYEEHQANVELLRAWLEDHPTP
jgi:hypothetical protein